MSGPERPSTDDALSVPQDTPPTIGEAFIVWLKIGLLSFGGPAAQIALMHRMVVAEKQWLSEKQYLSALSFCMLLPGPEAMQLATYSGWRLHGVRGGLIAGLLFVLPGAFIVLLLATIYSIYGNVPLIAGLFLGIKAAVIVVVIEALLRVAKKALAGPRQWVIAGIAFVGIFFLNLPFPLIILMAAIFGYFFLVDVVSDNLTAIAPPTSTQLLSTCRTVLLWLLIWIAPFILLWVIGSQEFLIQIGTFFSKLAVVTFGGAYAVLAYLAQDVVIRFDWLTAGEMMDGLGLAETTPGPLILVTEFVGFVAGFREGGFWLGLTAAMMALWVTFVPCFMWIFAGAPYIEWLGEQPRLKGAMSAITAAVVGVILNLSVWFALHVLFRKVEQLEYGPLTVWLPMLNSVDWRVALLCVLCGIAAFVFHWSISRLLVGAALLGLALSML